VLTFFITHRAIPIFVGDYFTNENWEFYEKIDEISPYG